MKVLFIGATGLVGRHTVAVLKNKFDIIPAAINGGEVAGLPVRQIDICDWENTEAALQKGTADGEPFDAVVYCATANYHVKRTNEEDQRLYFENCIEVNARGAYHVFEAAWRAKVPRVIHIGSMTALLGQPKYDYIDADTPDRPNDLYAATKIFGENVGRSYAFREPASGQRMKVICLRLAQPTAVDEPRTQLWIHSADSCGWAADMRDIALAIECGLTTDLQYGVYPVVSAADKIFVDSNTYSELGYRPQWKYDFSEEKGVEIFRAP